MIVVTGKSSHRVEFDTKDRGEAVRRFRELFPGADVETVGADVFVASCEVCGKAILDGDTYETDEGVYLCGECCGVGEVR